jgi:hypothetical protein
MGLSRRAVLLLVAAAIIVGFVVAVVWRIDSSSSPVDVATVYAADLAAVAIVLLCFRECGLGGEGAGKRGRWSEPPIK